MLNKLSKPVNPLDLAKKSLRSGVNVLGRIQKTASVAGLSALRVAKGDKLDAELMRDAFEQMGVTYIKLGQFIASTPSIFPREYVLAFQGCLDQTNPLAFRAMRDVLDAELGSIGLTVDEVFSSIDERPLASASIAQVHKAMLKDGRAVALKIQKPEVGTVMQTDLGVLHSVFWALERAIPSLRTANLAPIVDEMRARMLAETDFIAESRHIKQFLEHLAQVGNKKATAPYVHDHLTTKRLLVMDLFEGRSLIDENLLKQAGFEPKRVMSDVLDTWFLALMMTGEFHADLHAGNLMLLNDGRIGFLDFGLMGRIEPSSLQACFNLVQSLQMNDYRGMAMAMVGIGMTHRAERMDIDALAEDLKRMLGKVTTGTPTPVNAAANDSLNAMMLEMVEVGKRHGIHFPRDFALLTKQLLYFDRFMVTLAPDMDLFEGERLALVQS